MKIDKISVYDNNLQSNYKHNKTSFKSSFRTVYDNKFTFKYNTNTCFFRNDLEWEKFVNYINQKYKNADKVNIIDYACSTGEEPVSLALMLDIKFGKDAEKFYPIMAYDIDAENIKRASNGVFDINNDELNFLKKYTDDKYKKYFICHIDKDEMQGKLRLLEENKRKFIYNESDIIKGIDNIPSKNTILLCRNCFPYLQIGEKGKIIKQISKKLDSSSIIVLGKFDIDYGVGNMFEKEGFIHTEQYNVMEKLPLHKAFLSKILHKLKIK